MPISLIFFPCLLFCENLPDGCGAAGRPAAQQRQRPGFVPDHHCRIFLHPPPPPPACFRHPQGGTVAQLV